MTRTIPENEFSHEYLKSSCRPQSPLPLITFFLSIMVVETRPRNKTQHPGAVDIEPPSQNARRRRTPAEMEAAKVERKKERQAQKDDKKRKIADLGVLASIEDKMAREDVAYALGANHPPGSELKAALPAKQAPKADDMTQKSSQRLLFSVFQLTKTHHCPLAIQDPQDSADAAVKTLSAEDVTTIAKAVVALSDSSGEVSSEASHRVEELAPAKGNKRKGQ